MSRFVHFIRQTRTRSAGLRLYAKAGPALLALFIVCSLLGANFSSASAAGTTYYVDNTVVCSDANAGTSQGAPWCTLTKAQDTAITPGDTVIVLHGTYLEQVVPHSGTAGSPITFKAGPGATVTIQGSGGTSSAFAMSGATYVVIDGFNITETRGPGIYVQSSDHITISNNHVTYAGHNAGAESHQQGIKLKAVTYSTITGNTVDHNSCTGIRLVSGLVSTVVVNSDYNTISDNVIYYNSSTIAYPTVAVSDAAGIEIDDGHNNTVVHNDVHGNEDSGINIYIGTGGGFTHSGSSNNTVVGNLSYGNGDHGIDNNTSSNSIIVGNTVQGNFTSGINLEANSSGATIANNVMVNNGSNPGDRKGGNLYPDSTSLPTSMDYNLYYQSSPTAQQINYNGTPYMTLAAFKLAIPAMEVHGLEADPHFVSPAAPAPVSQAAYNVSGDYHLSGGSAAIDSANSSASGETSTDIDGNARYDDPGTTNTGVGTRAYDDRGAYEYQGGAGVLPTVTTGAVTNIGQTYATGNGNVTYLGSPAPTQHGVAWGTSVDPTIAGSHTEDGPVAATGAFTSNITGLTAGTLYHVRAYATNTVGTAYGSDVTFTALSGNVIITTPGTSSWTVPAGVTSFTVEVWGGGGRGGPADSGFSGKDYGGGGGGGAYSKKTVTVIAGHTYSVTVGAGSTSTSAGGDSSFSDNGTVVALAKGGGSSNSSSNANGGAASSGTGDTKYSGGNGAGGSNLGNYGGGGGSSAGTAANGNNATNQNGASAPTGGGSGGSGAATTTGTGTAGSTPGGAGGGGFRSTGTGTYAGGNGANGQLIISYVIRGTTTTAVNCGAGTPSLIYGAGISCVATVTRVSGPSSNLTGTVAWTTGGAGTFATSPCTLSGTGSTATCSVTYTPSAVGVSPHLLTASYAGDANFAPSIGTQNVTVNPKALTMSGLTVAASKIYDATTAAIVSGTPALLPAETLGTGTTADGKPYTGDVVSITGTPAGAYNSKDVATAANVTFSGLSLTGAAAGNYTLTVQSPAVATITAKALTMSGLTVPASKVYDATTAAVVSGTPILGAAEAPGAGTTADGLPYTGDTVSIAGTAVGTYNSKDVATAATVTFGGLHLGGAQASNYTLSMQAPALATITAKGLTVSGITAANRPYDGTVTATLNTASAALVGNLDGANVVLNKTSAAGVFTPDANIGTAKIVQISGLTITGSAIGNYSLAQPTTTANITAKALTVTGITASSKVYDATTAATINTTGATLVGVVGSETVGLDKSVAIGAFVNKSVGVAKTVNVSGLALTGTAASNYSLTQPTASADITVAGLTITGVTAQDKIYDATTAATLNKGSAQLSGVLLTDVVTLNSGSATGAFADKNVGTGKLVTVAGFTVSGTDAGNYTLAQPTGLTAAITVRDLTASATADDKIYNGTTPAVAHITTNKLGSDDVTGAYTAAAFDTKDVGTGKPVSILGITISGVDTSNYHLLNSTATATANITQAPLTITAIPFTKRSGTAYTFLGTEFTIDPTTPLYNGDVVNSVTLTSTGAAASAADGQYAIEISAAVGTGLSNYAITYHNGTMTVGPKNIGVPVIAEGDSTSVTMSVNGAPTAFSLTLHATDADSDPITWSISTAPSVVGALASVPAPATGNSMAISYTPAKNYLGTDSFVVTADDGFGGTDTIIVNVTVNPLSVTRVSAGASDGWVLESGELTAKGGSMNPTTTTFNLGDDASRKQYRGILSFNTKLPTGAVITGITLKVKTSTPAAANTMFTTFGNIAVDIKKGTFGTSALQVSDFETTATKSGAMFIKNNPLAGGWFFANLASSNANTWINKTGTTQIRLRFTKDDNNNAIANLFKLYSGNATTAAYRPVLIIQYYVPLP